MNLWTLCSDNPNIKAIFVIRDPVDRFISHYKFTVDQCKQYGLGNVPEAVEYLFRNGNNSLIYQFKKAADQALSISSLSSQVLSSYFITLNTRNRKISWKSLSFFLIISWSLRAPMELLHLIDLFYQGFGAKNKTDNLAMTLLHQSLYFPGLKMIFFLFLDSSLR